MGIEPQFFDRVFGIFQRLQTREQLPGTGIGLAVCKKIVERHGGKIWIESDLGRGATFFFTIPDKKPGTSG
jgi:light-regulated signal transduction histidine kinase (bacteriophytochrome)